MSRLARFALVGIAGTGTYYLILLVLVELAAVNVTVASTVAFVVVVTQNYMLHYSWTFGSTSSHTRIFPQFVAMSVTGLILNAIVMAIGSEALGFNYILVQAISIVCVIAWNTIVTHIVVFRDRV